MRQLIVATGNMDKLREVREILADPGLEILSLKEAGIDLDVVENGNTFEENAMIKARAAAEASGRMALADDSGLVIDCLNGEPGIYSARYMGRDTSYDEKNRNLIMRVNDFCRGYEEALDSAGRRGKSEGSEKGPERADSKPEADYIGGQAGYPQREATGLRVRQSRTSHPGSDGQGHPGPLRAARFICAVAAAWPDGRVKTVTGKMEGRIAYAQAGENGFGYDPIFYLPEYGKTSAEISEEEKNAISHRGKAFRAMREILLSI